MNRKIVIALGGNALGSNVMQQLALVKNTAQKIITLIKKNYQIIITHGNGPQVGDIHIKSNYPFPESNAMSQGYIGYHLQQALINELQKEKIKKNVVSLITQVLVDKNDPNFQKPTKPVGKFYIDEKEIKALNFDYIEDSGRGFRRVIASPKPLKIIEIDLIKDLINDQNNIVICCGGGGIPVILTDQGYQGIAAVIDKDKTSAELAIQLNADLLMILTAVENVYLDFNKPSQKALSNLTIKQALSYMAKKQFGIGSMLPKIEAAIAFVTKTKKSAVIGMLDKVDQIINKTSGTYLTY